ncbi:unannotated protein [freshwater metagenome]|uniref:Unannotated protein n=1 Tax=freshwater metagenome TaxID=449393 RepID=A0A6J6YBY9_9ZZZZ
MIWPSLMYVGPSTSAALRRRSEISALLAAVSLKRPRRLRTSHGLIAVTTCPATVSTRVPGGKRFGLVSTGTSARAARRSSGACAIQGMLLGSNVQGPCSVNAPQSRSLMACMLAAPVGICTLQDADHTDLWPRVRQRPSRRAKPVPMSFAGALAPVGWVAP